MESVFLHLVNMSITAGWLVLAVVMLRLVFQRAPKWIHCLLWVLVAIRLICPISIESVLSLIPSAETVPVENFLYETPSIHSGVPVVDNMVNPIISNDFAPQPMNSVNPMQVVSILAAYVWVLGVVMMALYMVITTLRLKWRVRESVRLRQNIFQCDRIATPFILGVIRPRIYLPTTLSETDVISVVAHEEAHIKRRDHWWKPLGFLLLTVYWFNPLLWLGYVLLCRDIEAACDQKVIRDMDVPQRKSYSETLLACSAPRHLVTACPLAFGETGVKSRIKAVLNYRKPAFWLIVVAVVAVAVAAVCLLTNPKTTVSDELDAYLTHVILEENAGDHTGDAYPTEAHTVFGVKQKNGKTVVYGMVLYEEYSLDENGALQAQSGSHIPTVITVDVEGNGYSLVEYWIPRDGTNYATDIRKKYPIWYWWQTDIQHHVDKHQQKTLADAKGHFGYTLTGTMEGWSKPYRYYVLNVTQADHEELIGKKVRVSTENLLGSGVAMMGSTVDVKYNGKIDQKDGILTVYALDLSQTDSDQFGGPDDDDSDARFTGKVIQVTDAMMLIECYEGEKFREVWVNYTYYFKDLEPKIGEEYTILHSDYVMETYPPQVTAEAITPVSSTPTRTEAPTTQASTSAATGSSHLDGSTSTSWKEAAPSAAEAFITEAEAIAIASEYWKMKPGDRDPDTGFMMSIHVMETPTKEMPHYRMDLRWLVETEGGTGNFSTLDTIYIHAETGDIALPGGNTAVSTAETSQTTTTTTRTYTMPTTLTSVYYPPYTTTDPSAPSTTYTGPTYPPYTTIATTTGSANASVTDSATTTTYYNPFAPIKDNSSAPGKDRQCLLFKVENEDVELTFESAMRYPQYNNRLLWHYTGTTKSGVSVTCLVVPEPGAIYSIDYGITNEWGKATTEDDVRSCLKSFIKTHQLPFDAEDASLFLTMSARQNEGKQEYIINWSFSFKLEEENTTMSGTIGLSKGKLKVLSIRATTDEEGQSIHGYYGDTITLLIPRWKSE